METKPYNLQSPEQIAKDYGGNKQKIAEAMQLGIVDPTAGTLAGMFIDRMRSAQTQEQAPQQTVAQQIFAPPAPSAPPQGAAPMGGPPQGAPPQGGMQPPAPPAGLGATPEAAQMQAPMPDMGAPEMAMPEEAPMEEAPISMAEGGLTTLPLPDTMFDEPNNGGYADGGIVAFAGGGYGSYFEDVATKAVPGLGVTSRQRTPAQNAAVDGVPNSFHQTDDARDFVPPKGMSMAAFHAKLKSEFGPQYDVINEGNHVHVEPGPGLAKSGQGLLNPAQAANPRTPTDVPGGNLADQMMPAFERAGEFYDKFMPKPKTEAREKMKDYVEKGMSEEGQKKQKNYDKWSALAQMGWSIAGSNSPNFLQAVAEGGKVAAASSQKSKEAREARFEKYLSQYAEIEGIENAEARERVKFMLDYGMKDLDLRGKDLDRGLRWSIDNMQNDTQRLNIVTGSADTRRGQNMQLQASLAGNLARMAEIDKSRENEAIKLATSNLQQNMNYRKETDPDKKAAIFRAEVQAILAAMPGSGSSGTGTPGLPSPDFKMDQ